MEVSIRKAISELAPYHVDERVWDIKLDANEKSSDLPEGVREKVTEALQKVVLQRYPNSDEPLRKKIADVYGVTPEHVALGCGSSEVLLGLCLGFGGKGREIVFPNPSFSMYEIYARIADSTAVPVELNEDFSLPTAKYIEKARNASLAILCNPNNPTGTVTPLAAVEEVVKNISCPIILDEAYMEFGGESAVSLLAKYPQLIIARTFSKAYGLAGTRVGYMIAAPELVAVLNKALLPYRVNALSLTAAETVFDNRELFQPAIQKTIEERERLSRTLIGLGVKVYPSQTNFILIRLPQAEELNQALEAKSIAVRSFGNAPRLEGCIRITVGTAAENDRLLSEIRNFLGK